MQHLRSRFGRASSRLVLGLAALTLVSLVSASDARAQARVDRNVVYGMFSGLALLMDVHRPDTPNGYGVIFVAGSAWSAPLAYGAGGLKEARARLGLRNRWEAPSPVSGRPSGEYRVA